MGKILVADDERGILDLMERVLGRRGHEVETFGDGASAIEAIEAGDYDVVITDLRMPHKGGLEVLAAAKARRATLPVIVVSASSEPEDRAQAELLGVYMMLHKPVDLAYLMTIVESAIAGKASGPTPAPSTSMSPSTSTSTTESERAPTLVRVVERDACLANLIGYCLRKLGFRVTSAASEEAAIAIVGAAPAVEGIRKEAPRAWIIALHATGDLEEAVAVLDAGADVALARPFEPEVLFAHVRAAARRAGLGLASPNVMPVPEAQAAPSGGKPITRNRMKAVRN